MRPPDAMLSYEEALAVDNNDLFGLTRSELYAEIARAARIAARNPRAMVFRGVLHISARTWADERIGLCLALLRDDRPPRRQEPKVKPWT
jgi:hypothetical protein